MLLLLSAIQLFVYSRDNIDEEEGSQWEKNKRGYLAGLLAYSKYIRSSDLPNHSDPPNLKPYAFPAVSVKIPEVLDWIKEHGAEELENCFPKD